MYGGNDSIEYESFFGLVKNDSYLLGSSWLSNQIDRSVISVADQALHDFFGRLNWLFDPGSRTSSLEDPTTFVLTLSHGRLSRASDPRDSIYGFLGLAASSITDRIKPDYDLSLVDTLRHVAVQITLSLDSLLLLSFTGRQIGAKEDLPTWVPDWRRVTPGSTEQLALEATTNRVKHTNTLTTSGLVANYQ